MGEMTDHDPDDLGSAYPQEAAETGALVEEDLREPPMYLVWIHNDDYTTRDFVVDVLKQVFHHDEAQATAIMVHVHRNGAGRAGLYPRGVAETKIMEAESMARAEEFPLQLTMEPDLPNENGDC